MSGVLAEVSAATAAVSGGAVEGSRVAVEVSVVARAGSGVVAAGSVVAVSGVPACEDVPFVPVVRCGGAFGRLLVANSMILRTARRRRVRSAWRTVRCVWRCRTY